MIFSKEPSEAVERFLEAVQEVRGIDIRVIERLKKRMKKVIFFQKNTCKIYIPVVIYNSVA